MTVRLWDAQTGAPGPILSGHTHFVYQRDVFAQRPSDCLRQLGRDSAAVGRANRCSWPHLKRPYCMSLQAWCILPVAIRLHQAVRTRQCGCGTRKPVQLAPSSAAILDSVFKRGVFAKRPSDCLGQCGQDSAAVGCTNRCTWSHLYAAILTGLTVWCIRPVAIRLPQASQDKTVRLWDVHTGAPGPILNGHTESVSKCGVFTQWSPDCIRK